MTASIKIYPSIKELAEDFAKEIILKIDDASSIEIPFNIMLSGGNTPKMLFEQLAKLSSAVKSWKHVHFYWGDERCVPPDDPESNFGMAKQELLNKIQISEANIHRIFGENDPESEARRYATEISNIPFFDLIMLGMGDDGHTVSIFPNNPDLMHSSKLCEVAAHPKTGQKRITITGKVINAAKFVAFLITGKNKAGIIAEIFTKTGAYQTYPASFVHPEKGELMWLLDNEAASITLKYLEK
jgi:6-phosphogluconolactonase